ncbi:MAG: TlpA family protein disulfide reductase, partial [Candidatus Marinimicrobia bacterium]|nr:TlpA family protein disulfide reductase [Candidatus Neomarinimicrobiota bacterium]
MINLRKKREVTAGIVVLLLWTVFLATNLTSTPRQSVGDYQSNADPFIGQKAPDFRLMDVDGNRVSLFDFSGKVVIINFWATWCVPCRWEIPGFVEQQESYPDDLVIVGISMDEDGPDVVPPFM